MAPEQLQQLFQRVQVLKLALNESQATLETRATMNADASKKVQDIMGTADRALQSPRMKHGATKK